MRPLELELTAFRSYDEARVDWRPHDLVVIAGPTGAGKSTLIDGICFALYGRTPETTRTADMLTLGRDHGEVRLTFARDGETWRVTRRFGPRAPEPASVLERLDGDGGDPVQSVTGDAAVAARIGALVGLGFQAFTSAVVLAQGRFAQFLQAKPAERDAILRELFGIASLEGARQRAQAAQAAAGARADALDGERQRLPEHTASSRAGAAAAARATAARRAALRALLPAAERVRAAHDAAGAAEARAATVRDALARLPGADDRRRIAAASARLDDGRRRARAELEAARAAVDAAEARRAAVRARHGADAGGLAAARAAAARRAEVAGRIPALHEEIAAAERRRVAAERDAAPRRALAARLDALGDLERARAAGAEATRAVAAAEEAAREAARRRDAARDAAAGADRALRDARVRDHAGAIRRELAPGDDCPVCGARVGELPHDDPAVDAAAEGARRARAAEQAAGEAAARADAVLGAARDRAAEAVAAEQAAVRALAAAGARPDDDRAGLRAELDAAEHAAAEAGRAGGALDGLRRELDGCVAEIARLERDLGAWTEAPDPVAEIDAALHEARAADEEATRARAAADAAARADEQARARCDELARREVAPVRQAAVLAAQALGARPPDSALDDASLMDAAEALARAGERAARDAGEDARRARARADRLRDELRERAAPLGVGSVGEIAPACERAAGALAEARAAWVARERAASEARRLEADAAAARAEAAVHRQVAADLRVDRFPRHLLHRYLGRLADGASARLHHLTGGAFRFARDDARDPLAVVDVRRGERTRAGATLSGGERFLASLALALGLADIAAESGGRLDCLFLDEGFSSLDAESLEQAMEGVERLAGDGRLVGVITHLPGVVERLGAAIHVHKDAAGVSHVGAPVADLPREPAAA